MAGMVEVVRLADGVAVVTLRRPSKRNALSIELRDDVSDVFDQLGVDTTVRAIIVTGEGPIFSAGFDLTEFADPDPDHQQTLWQSSDRFHHTILRCPIPVIAAVNGPAIAGGFDLAVLVDIRLASDTARFAHVEHTFGDVVYRPLREIVGGGLARDLVLTGRTVDADEALRIGLVSRVVAPGSLMAASIDVARSVAVAPREFLARTKAKIVDATGIPRSTTTLDL